MLRRLMFGALIGFYSAEPIKSEFAPLLGAILRALSHMVCLMYAFPLVDLTPLSQEAAISSMFGCIEEDASRRDTRGQNE